MPQTRDVAWDEFSIGLLLRNGFFDTELSQRLLVSAEVRALLEHLRVTVYDLLKELSGTHSPDTALKYLVLLLNRQPLIRETLTIPETRQRFFALIGSGASWGEFFLSNPGSATGFARILEESFTVDDETRKLYRTPASKFQELTGHMPSDFLRIRYREEIMRIVLKDVMSEDPLADITMRMAELSDAAAVVLEYAFCMSQATYERDYGAIIPVSIIALGKAGAAELNYISDVDVLFVTDDEDHLIAAEYIARETIKIINGPGGSQLPLWEVDTNLRPEGKDGALVRTIESYKNYYDNWADDWEFQALLKARELAGDLRLGRRFVELSKTYVWGGAVREGFVERVQRMRQRVIDNIAGNEKEREIKLGAGGLRDVEFTVQLLQLVHGRSDPSVRARDTLSALRQLAFSGYISRDSEKQLTESYRFLRFLEHRIQLLNFRRTHLMPDSQWEQFILSRSFRQLLKKDLKAAKGAIGSKEAVHELMAQWQAVKRRVRGLYERIVYRPLLPMTAEMSAAEVRLSSQAIIDRLRALGYRDPQAALVSIRALSDGVSRRAMLQKQLFPALLMWISQGSNPDAGLLGFRRVSEALGSTPWYLRMLRDSSVAAERLCNIVSISPVVTNLLESSTDAVFWLGDDRRLQPRSYEELWREINSKIIRSMPIHGDSSKPAVGNKGQVNIVRTVPELIRKVRSVRHRELLRIILGDACGLLSGSTVARGLFSIERMTLNGFLQAARMAECLRSGHSVDVVAVFMGSFGGREPGYASDVDVIFAYDDNDDTTFGRYSAGLAQRQAESIVHAVLGYSQQAVIPTIRSEIPIRYDMKLRPEGKNGAIVRSFTSYQAYYRQWAQTWEIQALLRARVVAGSQQALQKFTDLLDGIRYSSRLVSKELIEIRRIKARIEAERIPGAIDPRRHLKLGPGAVSDVEWLVQVLQLQHASRLKSLQVKSTMMVLRALVGEDLISQEDALVLERSWRLARSIRNANVIVGSAKDILPSTGEALDPIARWATAELHEDLEKSYDPRRKEWFAPPCSSGLELIGANLEEIYFRVTRHARAVFEKYFFKA